MSDIWSNLACWLRLDEASGTNASDSSGNSRTGTASGTHAWAAGMLAGGIDLDGTSGKVVLGHHATLGSTPLTVAMWVFPDALASLATFATKNTVVSPFTGWYLRRSPTTNALNAVISVAGGFHTAAGPANLTTSEWQHIGFTYDSETLIAYRSGTGGTGVTAPSGNIDTNSNDVWVGAEPATGGIRFVNGKIDDFRIYNRALSADDMAALAAWRPGTRYYRQLLAGAA